MRQDPPDNAQLRVFLLFISTTSDLDATRKRLRTSRMSSSKPMSTMRSASSRHRYLHTSSVMRFLASRSLSRPGVATIMCTPRRMASVCAGVRQSGFIGLRFMV